MERADESALGATFLGLDDRARWRHELTNARYSSALVTGRQDRDAEIVVGQERAGLGQVERQPDALRGPAEELATLVLGEHRIRVIGRGQAQQSPGIHGGAGIEVGTQLFDEGDLFIVAHI